MVKFEDLHICAKSQPRVDNILAKKLKGCTDIEVQLLADFIKCDVSEHANEVINSAESVHIVHSPLIKGEDINLEYYTHIFYRQLFFKVCEFAQKLANYYKNDIIVIIHNGFTLETYKYLPGVLRELVDIFKVAISLYPNVTYAFENVVPFCFDNENKVVSRAGFLFENVELANFFNAKCGKEVFGTVLDTCHVLTTMREMNMLFVNEPIYQKYDMDTFFKINKATIKVIHLANLEELGYKSYQHGTPFTETDKLLLTEIMELYTKYNYDCFLTLEVFEKDYLNCINFETTLNTLKSILE